MSDTPVCIKHQRGFVRKRGPIMNLKDDAPLKEFNIAKVRIWESREKAQRTLNQLRGEVMSFLDCWIGHIECDKHSETLVDIYCDNLRGVKEQLQFLDKCKIEELTNLNKI